MMYIYKTSEGLLQTLQSPEKDCWISLIRPTHDELQYIRGHFGIDMADLQAALDEEEQPRVVCEEDYNLILVDVPTVAPHDGTNHWDTLPLGIVLCHDAVITICLEDTPVLHFFDSRRIRGFHTHMKTRFLLQLLYRNAALFLQDLRAIQRKSEKLEQKLRVSTQNRELLELRELEKSLLYFTTSLRSNESVLDRLLKTNAIPQYPEDRELLEDVIVENRQAMEMANIYSSILRGTADAFGTIISNNLNMVMKRLSIITIVMSIPTMIFSAYGMNLNLSGMPLAQHPFAFPIMLVFSLALAGLAALCFRRL